MDSKQIHDWATALAAGEVTPEQFTTALEAAAGTASLADATLDLDRRSRCGYPEIIYGAGKTVSSLVAIIERLLSARQPVLATRVDETKSVELLRVFPSAHYNGIARTFRVASDETIRNAASAARVAIVTAGTSDLPVAEEARETVEWMGLQTVMIHDVGVAGPHRLPIHVETLRSAAVVIVVAGMEVRCQALLEAMLPCRLLRCRPALAMGPLSPVWRRCWEC